LVPSHPNPCCVMESPNKSIAGRIRSGRETIVQKLPLISNRAKGNRKQKKENGSGI
jgi:hypothetical protein